MRRLPNEHWGDISAPGRPCFTFRVSGPGRRVAFLQWGWGERSGAPQSWWEERPSLGSGPHSLPLPGPRGRRTMLEGGGCRFSFAAEPVWLGPRLPSSAEGQKGSVTDPGP